MAWDGHQTQNQAQVSLYYISCSAADRLMNSTRSSLLSKHLFGLGLGLGTIWPLDWNLELGHFAKSLTQMGFA
jgi:hypothetical protein